MKKLFDPPCLSFPEKPSILGRLSHLQKDPHNSMDEVMDIIATYPGLEERIISLANSPRFRGVVAITSMKPALLRLGMSQILSLLVGMILLEYYQQRKNPVLETYYRKMRTTSLNVATLSFVLAYEKTKVDPEQAMLAGIIHNIGVLPLLLRLDQVPEIHNNQKLMHQVSTEIIPKYYPLAGRILMQEWQMSPELVEVASSHQNIQRHISAEIDLVDIVVLAKQLSKFDFSIEDVELPPRLN